MKLFISYYVILFSRELWRLTLHLVYRYHFISGEKPHRVETLSSFTFKQYWLDFSLSISIQRRSICALNFPVLFLFLYLLTCCSKTNKIGVFSHKLVLKKSIKQTLKVTNRQGQEILSIQWIQLFLILSCLIIIYCILLFQM